MDAYPSFDMGETRKDPTPMDIEMEANRLIYIRQLSSKEPQPLLEGDVSSPAVIGTVNGEEKKEELSPRTVKAPTSKKPSTSASSKSKDDALAEDNFVIARHVSDFGHIVLGQTRKRTFKITNTSGLGQLSWVFEWNPTLTKHSRESLICKTNIQ